MSDPFFQGKIPVSIGGAVDIGLWFGVQSAKMCIHIWSSVYGPYHGMGAGGAITGHETIYVCICIYIYSSPGCGTFEIGY